MTILGGGAPRQLRLFKSKSPTALVDGRLWRGWDRDPSSARHEGTEQDDPTLQAPVGPTYRVAAYTVCPSGYHDVDGAAKERWCLSVVDAGNGWAIRRGDRCLNIALQWEDEREAALCDAAFIRRCRYNEHAALLRARRVVDRLEVAGLTFDEFAMKMWAATENGGLTASDSDGGGLPDLTRPVVGR